MRAAGQDPWYWESSSVIPEQRYDKLVTSAITTQYYGERSSVPGTRFC